MQASSSCATRLVAAASCQKQLHLPPATRWTASSQTRPQEHWGHADLIGPPPGSSRMFECRTFEARNRNLATHLAGKVSAQGQDRESAGECFNRHPAPILIAGLWSLGANRMIGRTVELLGKEIQKWKLMKCFGDCTLGRIRWDGITNKWEGHNI